MAPATTVSATMKIALTAKQGDATVTWTSSNTSAIANNGTVTHGMADVTVHLLQHLLLDMYQTKTFTVVVLAQTITDAEIAAQIKALSVAEITDKLGGLTIHL